jgi:hypothetical protein
MQDIHERIPSLLCSYYGAARSEFSKIECRFVSIVDHSLEASMFWTSASRLLAVAKGLVSGRTQQRDGAVIHHGGFM